jgi:PAS domain S-box-containing protein
MIAIFDFIIEVIDKLVAWTRTLFKVVSRQSVVLFARLAVYRNSLSFLFVSIMVFLALIPVLLVSAGTYYRSRSFIQEQTAQQLQNIVQGQSPPLIEIAANNQLYITDILAREQLHDIILRVLETPNDANQYITWAELQSYVQSNQSISDTNVDAILLLNPNNKVVVASKREWGGMDLSGLTVIQKIANTSKTYSTYSSAAAADSLWDLYPFQWITLSARPIKNSKNDVVGTLIITSIPRLPKTILETTNALFPEGRAFFVSFDNTIVGINKSINQIIKISSTESHTQKLLEMFQNNQLEGGQSYLDAKDVPVIAYAKWLPEMNTGFVIEVPESVIFKQIETLVPFTFLLLGISIVFIAGFVFLSSRALVNPITQLTNSARNFAKGDWSERSKIQRKDEIGVLAATFNQMVEQITDLYRSLEQKVEERARQLRTASEVGQLATSANNREEIIDRAAKLVVDRFGYSFANIFIIDQTGTAAVLQASHSETGDIKNPLGFRIAIAPESLVGWVAKNNQARVVSDFAANEFPSNELLLENSKSEIALPIAIGNQILGVFEVQSVNTKAFEAENISVLQTLANQIANGIQNLRLLEATQVNLEETNLLYRTSRQISFTKTEAEMFQVVREGLTQTPYITGIFSVEEDYLSITSITDPRNLNASTTTQGITLPLLRIKSLLEHQQMVLVDNVSKPTDFDVILSFFARRSCHSAAIFPIFDQERLIKIIVLGSRETTPMSQAAMQPFLSLMEVISTTSQRFKILNDLQEQISILQILKRVSEAISNETDLKDLYKTLHTQIGLIMGTDISFLISLYNESTKMIHVPYVFEKDDVISIPPFPLGEGLSSYVIQTRQPLMIVKDTVQRIKEMGSISVGKPARSWLGVPLMLGTRVIGVMVVQDALQEERFNQNDLNLLTVLAPQVAVTIRNVELLTEMQQALRAYDQERFLLNTLMDNIPDQIFFKDQQGQYIRVSQSYASQHNFENPLALVGKSDFDILDESSATDRKRIEQEILALGQPVLGDIEKIRFGEDQEAWKISSRIPMTTPTGEKVGLLGISRDITELKTAEELARSRANELQIVAEIARDTSGTLNTADLLRNAVHLIRERFDFYHASIFLLDAVGEYAVLKESTGEVGEMMKQRNHRLAVGSKSIVGQVTVRKEPWVVNDVRREPLYYPNPLLPDTRSELGIPLLMGDRVLGAIDVQSTAINAFMSGEVNILHLLADQLAIAVWNSLLFGQIQKNLSQHRLLHQITLAASAANSIDDALAATVQSLHTIIAGERAMVMMFDGNVLQVRTAVGYEGVDFSTYALKLGEGIPGMAAEQRKPVWFNHLLDHPELPLLDPNTQSELAVPIYFSDRLIGVLDVCSHQPGLFNETDQEILVSLGNTLGAIVANAQLVREVRQQVDRQQMLYDITGRIRRTTDIQTILQTSAREIARSLGAKRAHIEITVEEASQANKEQDGNGHKNGQEVKA